MAIEGSITLPGAWIKLLSATKSQKKSVSIVRSRRSERYQLRDAEASCPSLTTVLEPLDFHFFWRVNVRLILQDPCVSSAKGVPAKLGGKVVICSLLELFSDEVSSRMKLTPLFMPVVRAWSTKLRCRRGSHLIRGGFLCLIIYAGCQALASPTPKRLKTKRFGTGCQVRTSASGPCSAACDASSALP